MKKVTTILAAILLMAVGATAQKLSYSAVVRNSDNELVVNANLTVAVSIANSSGGAVVYSETHNVTTNQNGLVTLTIGDGTGVTGSMSDVTWQTAFITSDYTLPNGSHVMNTTPVTAVPYALYAEKSGSSAAGSTSGSASIDGGAVNFSMPISDFVNNLTDEQKAELCEALGCSSGGGGDGGDTPDPGTEPTTFTCGTSKMVDADGNKYETVQIGTLCWTKTNLRVAVGTNCTSSGHFDYTEPCYYENNLLDADTCGYLYNWEAAKLACPSNWHLPEMTDYITLTNYLSNTKEGEHYLYRCDQAEASSIARALASTAWTLNPSTTDCAPSHNPPMNNASGFGALPAGWWSVGFKEVGESARFWSSTEGGESGLEPFSAWFFSLSYLSYATYYVSTLRGFGLSVRCVRD